MSRGIPEKEAERCVGFFAEVLDRVDIAEIARARGAIENGARGRGRSRAEAASESKRGDR